MDHPIFATILSKWQNEMKFSGQPIYKPDKHDASLSQIVTDISFHI